MPQNNSYIIQHTIANDYIQHLITILEQADISGVQINLNATDSIPHITLGLACCADAGGNLSNIKDINKHLIEKMDEISFISRQVTMVAYDLSVFESRYYDKPNLLVLKLKNANIAGEGNIERLNQEIVKRLKDLGLNVAWFCESDDFAPHITLGTTIYDYDFPELQEKKQQILDAINQEFLKISHLDVLYTPAANSTAKKLLDIKLPKSLKSEAILYTTEQLKLLICNNMMKKIKFSNLLLEGVDKLSSSSQKNFFHNIESLANYLTTDKWQEFSALFSEIPSILQLDSINRVTCVTQVLKKFFPTQVCEQTFCVLYLGAKIYMAAKCKLPDGGSKPEKNHSILLEEASKKCKNRIEIYEIFWDLLIKKVFNEAIENNIPLTIDVLELSQKLAELLNEDFDLYQKSQIALYCPAVRLAEQGEKITVKTGGLIKFLSKIDKNLGSQRGKCLVQVICGDQTFFSFNPYGFSTLKHQKLK